MTTLPRTSVVRPSAGGARGQVAGLHQGDLEAAGGGVQGDARADHAAADHDDVEVVLPQSRPGSLALLGAEELRSRLLAHARLLRVNFRLPRATVPTLARGVG